MMRCSTRLLPVSQPSTRPRSSATKRPTRPKVRPPLWQEGDLANCLCIRDDPACIQCHSAAFSPRIFSELLLPGFLFHASSFQHLRRKKTQIHSSKKERKQKEDAFKLAVMILCMSSELNEDLLCRVWLCLFRGSNRGCQGSEGNGRKVHRQQAMQITEVQLAGK